MKLIYQPDETKGDLTFDRIADLRPGGFRTTTLSPAGTIRASVTSIHP